MHNTALLCQRFFSLLGDCSWTNGNYSSEAVRFAQPFVFGSGKHGIDPMTLLHSKLIILWGANVSVTRFGGRLENILKEAAKRGIKIIVIDPRKTRTVIRLNAEWIQIKPATDTALMLGIIFELIRNKSIDENYLERYTVGSREFFDYVLGETDGIPKTPEWASGISGVSVDAICMLAKKYSEIKPIALIPGLSIQRTIGGEEASRTAIILQTITRNIGVKGGSTGGKYWDALPRPIISRIFSGKLNYKYSIPVYEWADHILKPDTDIRMIYNIGSNLLNQGSDIQKNISAVKKLDFVVTHDMFLTATAKFSDIILPTTMWTERNDVVVCSDNYLFYSNKAVEPPKTVKNDYDILAGISKELNLYEQFTENMSADEWLDKLISESEIDNLKEFKDSGIYSSKEQERYSFSDFIDEPAKYPLNTHSGKFEISSTEYAKTGFSPYPKYRNIKENKQYPLILITPHARLRINSSHGNIEFFNKLEDDDLWMNSEDAEIRGISGGDKVEVNSKNGSIAVRVKVCNSITKGAVSLNQGIWAKFSEHEVDGAPNLLTSSSPTLPSHGSRTHFTYVEVKLLPKLEKL